MKRLGKLNCVTVWLVLLGFLCGMMMPAVSVARVHREIDTEGDPTDGLGLTDGGGAGFGASDQGTNSVPPSTLIGDSSVSLSDWLARNDGFVVFAVIENGHMQLVIQVFGGFDLADGGN